MNGDPSEKMCADIFEAIIGALYWWGYYVKGMGYGVIGHIKKWILDNPFFEEAIRTGKTFCD